MILNGYAILDGFLCLARLGVGVWVLALGLTVWRAWGRPGPEGKQALEDRCYLLFLLAGLLLVLNVVSWPVFYLLLQSYVREWPGLMCIYGVTRIGTGSQGFSRYLPPLVQGLQAAKPVLVFLSGAWFVLYLLNRRTETAPLTGRLLVVLMAAGLLAVGDALAEAAYLAIPKKEEFPTAGCCTAAQSNDFSTRLLPPNLMGESMGQWLTVAFYAVNGVLLIGLVVSTFRSAAAPGRVGLILLLLLGAVAILVSGLFLIEVAAPTLLHQPNHHCPYDLIERAPEAVVAVAFFLGGCFFLGWAGVAQALGRSAETEPLLPGTQHRLFRWSLGSYLAALILMTLKLALA